MRLWDACSGVLRASYRGYDEADEVTAAYSLAFSTDGGLLLGGYSKCIRLFHVGRPGRDCSRITTHKKKQEGSIPGDMWHRSQCVVWVGVVGVVVVWGGSRGLLQLLLGMYRSFGPLAPPVKQATTRATGSYQHTQRAVSSWLFFGSVSFEWNRTDPSLILHCLQASSAVWLSTLWSQTCLQRAATAGA